MFYNACIAHVWSIKTLVFSLFATQQIYEHMDVFSMQIALSWPVATVSLEAFILA